MSNGLVLTDRAGSALVLELLDLAVGLNHVVLERSHGAFGVLVRNLLGLCVDLLFALTLTALGINPDELSFDHNGRQERLTGVAASWKTIPGVLA